MSTDDQSAHTQVKPPWFKKTRWVVPIGVVALLVTLVFAIPAVSPSGKPAEPSPTPYATFYIDEGPPTELVPEPSATP